MISDRTRDGAHRLAELLETAARGEPLDVESPLEVLPAAPGPVNAVVAFTGHNVIAADLSADEILSHVDPDDLVAPLEPAFLVWMGERLGSRPGMVAAVLAATSADSSPSIQLIAIDRPPSDTQSARIERAFRYREEVTLFADPERRGVVILGRGLARRWEVAIEIDPAHRSKGLGRELLKAATSLVPHGEPVFAQVPPGNAASLRAFLGARFRPIGAEVPFLKAGAGRR